MNLAFLDSNQQQFSSMVVVMLDQRDIKMMNAKEDLWLPKMLREAFKRQRKELPK